jgi:galactoside 2-L-fucosyltransferase 1/2
MPNISDLTVVELRKKAKLKGLYGYSRLYKADLIKLLEGTSTSRSRSKSSSKTHGSSDRSASLEQVAFCFLLMHKIDHEKLWEDFFDQDIEGTSTMYAHYKDSHGNSPDWLVPHSVKSVRTDWCGEGLIHSFSQMLKKALKNPNNKHFALLSGACIPLYTYNDTYKMITSTDRARMEYTRISGNVFEDRKDIYNGHQWVILNRQVAKDYIRLSDKKDTKAQKFIDKFRKMYKENGVIVGNKKVIVDLDTTWLGGCPDEIYPINWLVELYGKNVSKHVKKQMTTYTSWDFKKDALHPEVFNIKMTKRAKKEIYSNGHIFARKFTDDAAEYIAMGCKGKKKNNVIVRKELVGRIGNQMFQYASALGIAYKKNGNACIITDEDLISYDELRKDSEDLINVCKGPFNTCGRLDYPFTVVPEKSYAKYDLKPFMVPGSIEIETDMDQGFLQSYRYFEDISDIIKEKFQFKDDVSSTVTKYMKKMKSGGYKVVGLHARRGDHLSLGYMRFPPSSYFDKARYYFRKKYGSKVRFIVATNDRSWAQQTLSDKDTEIISHSKSATEDLAILAACDGVIISLGTFGWWGGWLCGGTVVYYANEFNMSNEINKGKVKKSDYYPLSWIQIK